MVYYIIKQSTPNTTEGAFYYVRTDTSFIYNAAAYLKTLEMVKTLQAKMFIPAHAAASEDIADLAQYNIDKVREIADKITGICKEPLCFEAILQRLFADYGRP